MSTLSFTVDQNQKSDFDPIPKGTYKVYGIESGLKSTVAGDGEYVAVTFEISEGQHKGRRIWCRFNIKNKNPIAVEIGTKQLNSLCLALGIDHLQDTDQLIHKPVMAKVKVTPARGGYDESNDITAFKPVENGFDDDESIEVEDAKPWA